MVIAVILVIWSFGQNRKHIVKLATVYINYNLYILFKNDRMFEIDFDQNDLDHFDHFDRIYVG
jgi:hypothetical protein